MSEITIPVTGVSLDCEALTAGTEYHVYVYDNSGTTTIEASATAPTLTSDGIEVKTGATSRRWIGKIVPIECQSGYQGPVAVPDMQYVANAFNEPSVAVGKNCPYSAQTLRSVAGASVEKFNNGDDYTIGILAARPASLMISSYGYGADSELGIGFNLDSAIMPVDQSGISCISTNGAITATKRVSPGKHAVYAMVGNVEATANSMTLWDTTTGTYYSTVAISGRMHYD